MKIKEKLNIFLENNPNIKLTEYQINKLDLIFNYDIISKNFEIINFLYSVDNEIFLVRIVSNVERAIIIGKNNDDGEDLYFISFKGLPPKGDFYHIQQDDVDIDKIINLFTQNL